MIQNSKHTMALLLLSLAFQIKGLTNISLLKRYLPTNPIIIEAGAHNGSDTVKLSSLWPQSTIYAFEPVPELFDELKKKITDCGNVIALPLALGDKIGTSKFHVSSKEGTGSSSLLTPKAHLHHFPWINFNREIEVSTVTIDEFARQNQLEKIDLLWLDLQGYEYYVLKASPDILKRVTVIATEVNFFELYNGCVLYPAYRKWLESHGFVQVHMERPHTSWGDAVFVRQ